MSATIRAIALQDDVAIIRATEKLHSQLARAFAPISGAIVAELKSRPAKENSAAELLAYLNQHGDALLDNHTSVVEARRLLVTAADQPHLAQLVSDCVADWPDERNRVGLALSYGAIISVWLMILTTEVNYEDASPGQCGKRVLTVHKKTRLPDMEVELTRLSAKLKVANAGKEHEQPSQTTQHAPAAPSPHPKSTDF